MQRFDCPFCGLRDEREFSFAGEAGKIRPDTTGPVSDTDWAEYLYMQSNPKGATEEIWVHLTCQEYFAMTRDSVTGEVFATTCLRTPAP